MSLWHSRIGLQNVANKKNKIKINPKTWSVEGVQTFTPLFCDWPGARNELVIRIRALPDRGYLDDVDTENYR